MKSEVTGCSLTYVPLGSDRLRNLTMSPTCSSRFCIICGRDAGMHVRGSGMTRSSVYRWMNADLVHARVRTVTCVRAPCNLHACRNKVNIHANMQSAYMQTCEVPAAPWMYAPCSSRACAVQVFIYEHVKCMNESY
eukprot:366574-Chlamydomonas_euryale.AAC.3